MLVGTYYYTMQQSITWRTEKRKRKGNTTYERLKNMVVPRSEVGSSVVTNTKKALDTFVNI